LEADSCSAVGTFSEFLRTKVPLPCSQEPATSLYPEPDESNLYLPALDGGEWSASRPGRALPPGKGPPVPIVQEAGWAPEPV